MGRGAEYYFIFLILANMWVIQAPYKISSVNSGLI